MNLINVEKLRDLNEAKRIKTLKDFPSSNKYISIDDLDSYLQKRIKLYLVAEEMLKREGDEASRKVAEYSTELYEALRKDILSLQ